MTTAMSAIFFVMWFVWAIQANGVGGFLKHFFGPKGETSGIVKILMIVIFFAVGWLEVISILFRPIPIPTPIAATLTSILPLSSAGTGCIIFFLVGFTISS